MAELTEEEKQQAEAQAQQQTTVPLPEYEKQQYVRGTNPYANATNPYDTFINDYASRIGTPEQIAEQEKKIQRGRTFWQGMNALTNVMANYINTNGVGQGAPNMTFNDNTQKLVDAWSANDDKRYRERKALSDKYDQLRQNQAIFNTNIEQNKAKWEADEDAKERAFNASEEAKAQQVRMDNAKILHNEANAKEEREFRKAEREASQRFQAGQAAASRQFQKEQKEEDRKHQENITTIKSQSSKGYNSKNNSIRIGNVDFVAESEQQADANISQVYGYVLDAMKRRNAASGNTNPLLQQQEAFYTKPEEQYAYINTYINSLYATDPKFKEEFDNFIDTHARSVSKDYGSEGNGNGGSAGTMPGVKAEGSAGTMPGVK